MVQARLVDSQGNPVRVPRVRIQPKGLRAHRKHLRQLQSAARRIQRGR